MSNENKKPLIKNPYLRRNIQKGVCIALLFIIALAVYYAPQKEKLKEDFSSLFTADGSAEYDRSLFSVHFIDVGQANAVLIYEPSGKCMLIDTGSKEYETEFFDYLETYAKDEFEYAVFSHMHDDHVGNASRFLKEFYVKNIIAGKERFPSFLESEVFSAIEDSKAAGSTVIYPEPEKVYFMEDAKITLLSPLLSDDNLNNESIVLRVDYKDVSFLFTADAEEKLEKALLESGAHLDCDVLEVAHHGAGSSSSAEFLNFAKPKIAVISCAKENNFGHPSLATVARLQQSGADIYYTFRDGNIVVSTDGKELFVSTSR